MKRILAIRGMLPRELKAEARLIPDAIKRKIPGQILKSLLAGEIIESGFGLGGNTDGGKTMAIAAILKLHVKEWAMTMLPRVGPNLDPSWFEWVSWPDEVIWLRANAINPDTPGRIEHLASVPMLILDDLGRERIKGSYVDDWAASQLDAIVNGRYRKQLVTVWTTNVTEADLVSLYGAALMRRLTADNPLIWIDGLGGSK